MRLLALLFGAGVLLTAYGVYAMRSDGVVRIIDERYEASIIGTAQRHGFGAPDGLRRVGEEFLFADEGRSAVLTWKPGSRAKLLAQERDGVDAPEDLVIDAAGHIYFTDDNAGGLWRIADGHVELVAGPAQGLVSTEGLALAPDGSLVVGEATQPAILRVTPAGDVSQFVLPPQGMRKPESMAFDDAGNLFLADNDANVIYLLDTAGIWHELLGTDDGIMSPESITFVGGTLYITDDDAGKVYAYDRDNGLRTIAVFEGELKNVQGVFVDERGDIYVSVQVSIRYREGFLVKLAIRK